MDKDIDASKFKTLTLHVFRLFDLREIEVSFDSHPDFTGSTDEPEIGRDPRCDSIKLYRQESLDEDLTSAILSHRIEANLNVYTLLERYTLSCAETHFPFWAGYDQGGDGTLTITSDGSAVLSLTRRSADPDDDTEYIYSACKPVKFLL